MESTSVQYQHVANDTEYRADRYYRYRELTAILHGWQSRYSGLMVVESIGKSWEGRDIWGVTLTNAATGPHHEKPGYHIDANIHAGEVTGSAVALYTMHWMLNNHGSDERASWILDNLALYVVPRICVDGSEVYLNTPTMLRSSVRPYPLEDDGRDGMRRTDLNGDGYITLMRVPDANGPWALSARDPRILVRRAPDAVTGEFYRVFPEGEVIGPIDGALEVVPTSYGLDLNRNFPIDWVPDTEQSGAGPYPFSEPEIRSLADWMLSHPNLSGSQHHHTHGGIIIRPSSFRPDAELPEHDAAIFQAFGALGTEETGYPAVSLWEGFTPDSERRKGGTKNTDLDWVYERLGIFPFTVELWNLYLEAGVLKEGYDYIHGHQAPEEHELTALAWADQHLGTDGFHPWEPFEHPQLGPVEIGGWTQKFTHQNPPASRLADICHRNTMFSLRCAMCAPRVRITSLEARRHAEGISIVRAVVENTGFLPTWVSDAMRAAGKAEPVFLELTGEGVQMLAGPPRRDAGDLAGRSDEYRSETVRRGSGNLSRRAVEWAIAAPKGTVVTVMSRSRSGGVDRSTVTLP